MGNHRSRRRRITAPAAADEYKLEATAASLASVARANTCVGR